MPPKLRVVPCFSATSPFFLKLSVTVLNVTSMMLLLQKAAVPTETPPHDPALPPHRAQLSVSESGQHLYRVVFDQHHGIFSSSSSARPRWKIPMPDDETCQNTTSAAWHYAAGRRTGLATVHRAAGGLLFATLPLVFSIFSVVVCLSPVVTTIAPPRSTHRSAMCTVIVQSVVYGLFCLHASLVVARYILVDGFQGAGHVRGGVGTRVLVSALSLHTATHILYQTYTCHSRLLLAPGVRRFTRANSSIVRPAMIGCLCTVHLLSVLTPAASLDIVGSVKDMVIAHAVAAFIPEILGSIFLACSDAIHAVTGGETEI